MTGGGWALKEGISRRSRLLRGTAIDLRAEETSHLKGRSDDIDRLVLLFREHTQIHLVGESGAGKSALLQAGLVPTIRDRRELAQLPLYMNVWGEDWEAGPRAMLTHALFDALSPEQRAALKIAGPPAPSALVSLLACVHDQLRLTPLCLFDQFDDYQTRHRDRFLPGANSTWLPASELAGQNGFWAELKTLLERRMIRCLFVTRADSADGLESVRFTAPKVYRLDRLKTEVVASFIDELGRGTGDSLPAIDAPGQGWERLKARLVVDLSQEGSVLPVQLKIALQGLKRLKFLTVHDYDREGGLRGLEAAHIDWHVSATAAFSQMDKSLVRRLLCEMIDPDGTKTVHLSSAELKRRLGASALPRTANAIEIALDHLAMKELLRKRLDLDSGHEVWLLDHDYLCRGVLESVRRANRWTAMAQNAFRSFTGADGNLLLRWRALLAPSQQILLVVQRVRGRFHYGPFRAYAAWSILRLVPYATMLAFAAWAAWLVSCSRDAERMLSGLGSSREMDSLWQLATAGSGVRDQFLTQALDGNAERIDPDGSGKAALALVGLDHMRREQVLRDTIVPCLRVERDPQILAACVRIGFELSGMGRLAPTEANVLFRRIASMLTENSDWDLGRTLALALSEVCDAVQPADTPTAVEILVHLMERTDDPAALRAMAAGLASALSKTPLEHVEVTIHGILTAPPLVGAPYIITGFAEQIPRLTGRLSNDDADRLFRQMLDTISRTTDSQRVATLGRGLQVLVTRLPPQIVRANFNRLLKDVYGTHNAQKLDGLGTELQALVAGLPLDEVVAKFHELLDSLRELKDHEKALTLDKVLRVVAARLPEGESTSSVDSLLSLLIEQTDSEHLLALAEVLRATTKALPVDKAQQTFTLLLSMMESTTDPFQLRALAAALRVVPGALPEALAQRAFSSLLLTMEQATGPFELRALAKAINDIPGQLPKSQSEAELLHLLSAIDECTSAVHFAALAEAVGNVPGRMDLEILINLLKWPLSVGVARSTLLAKIEELTEQKLHGDVWQMSVWAQQAGYDLARPPHRCLEGGTAGHPVRTKGLFKPFRIGSLTWSSSGPIAGMYCTPINEPTDQDTWGDNYLCSDEDIGARWSFEGPISGMRCVLINEPAEPIEHAWRDNYLCVPESSPYHFIWSHAGPPAGLMCLGFQEGTDVHSWDDNYLCWSQGASNGK